MKTIWIIANWKSDKNIAQALEWVSIVGPKIPQNPSAGSGLKVVVCPAFSCLAEVVKAIKVNNFPLMVGTQDLSAFGVGAYTGAEPAELLKDLVSLSILGHSERRKYFSETDKLIAKKVIQAKQNNITPLLCVQDENTPVPVGIKLIAYEPVWAIGSGKADTPENANEIARKLKEKHGYDLEILYGGSVNSSNVKSFTEQSDISGVLVGGASLDDLEFIKIIEAHER